MLGAADLAEEIRAGRRDPVDAVERALAAIATTDGAIGAFVLVDEHRARAEARNRSVRLSRGDEPGPLHGVPFAVKDVFDVAGQPTKAGSQVPPDPVPTADATAVARMRAAGAVLIGRTRTHEFAWGVTSQHPRLGGTRNPHDLERVPGGSSGGSAAAVAAGMVPLALGTDTACSVRLPAAWCGVVGHKPTHGVVPVTRVVPLAPSIDHVGTLATSIRDAWLAFAVLTDANLPAKAPFTGRVGVVSGTGFPPPTAVVAEAMARAEAALTVAGAACQPVTIPLADRVQEIYRLLQAPQALGWHTASGRWPRHADAYTEEVRARLEFCERVTPSQVTAAHAMLAELGDALDRLLTDVDVLLLPVASSAPPRVADVHACGTDAATDPGAQVLPWTLPASLCGLPACSLPVSLDASGLPTAVQLVGRRGDDVGLLDAAATLESALTR